MKKRICALFIAFTLIFGFSSYVNAADNIQINKSSNSVVVSGQVKEKNENVTLLVLRSSDDTRMYIDQMKSDSNGNFKFDIYLDYGDYKAQICTKNDKYNVGSFSISKPNDNSGSKGGGGGSSEPLKENKTMTFEFSKDKLINDINDTSKTQVVIEAKTNNSSENVEIKLSSDVVKSILNNKKDIMIKLNDVNLELNQKILETINDNSDIRIVVNQANSNQVNSNSEDLATVSKVYDFNLQSGNKNVHNFESPVKVIIKFDKDKVKDVNKLGAYYYNEEKKSWEYVGGTIKDDSTISFDAMHFSKYAAIENNKTFSDIKNHWAKYNIEVMSAKNIVKGISNDSFAPNDNVTRAEFCTLLARSLNLKADNYIGIFKDVSKDAWYSNAVESVSNAKIVNGFDGCFNPNAKITREEMAVMIVRAMEYKNINLSKSDLSFKDKDSISSWAEEYVKKAVNKGVMKGLDDNKFAPKSNATRAEAAVMIYRILKG